MRSLLISLYFSACIRLSSFPSLLISLSSLLLPVPSYSSRGVTPWNIATPGCREVIMAFVKGGVSAIASDIRPGYRLIKKKKMKAQVPSFFMRSSNFSPCRFSIPLTSHSLLPGNGQRRLSWHTFAFTISRTSSILEPV